MDDMLIPQLVLCASSGIALAEQLRYLVVMATSIVIGSTYGHCHGRGARSELRNESVAILQRRRGPPRRQFRQWNIAGITCLEIARLHAKSWIVLKPPAHTASLRRAV